MPYSIEAEIAENGHQSGIKVNGVDFCALVRGFKVSASVDGESRLDLDCANGATGRVIGAVGSIGVHGRLYVVYSIAGPLSVHGTLSDANAAIADGGCVAEVPFTTVVGRL